MAKPNYRFDKRQREIKKSQKQEEKRLKKLARNASVPADENSSPSVDTPTQGQNEGPDQGVTS